MDPISICLGVWAAICGTISAFKSGKDFWRQWRQKRKMGKLLQFGSDHWQARAIGSGSMNNGPLPANNPCMQF